MRLVKKRILEQVSYDSFKNRKPTISLYIPFNGAKIHTLNKSVNIVVHLAKYVL